MHARVTGGGRRRPSPRGMVTVELAIGTVTATVLAAALVTLVMLGVTQAAVAESSAQIARQIARGDDDAERQARERMPGTALVEYRDGGVEVTVEASSFVIGMGHVPVTAATWVAFEPGVSP